MSLVKIDCLMIGLPDKGLQDTSNNLDCLKGMEKLGYILGDRKLYLMSELKRDRLFESYLYIKYVLKP